MAERKSSVEMFSEFLREAGCLVFVFNWLGHDGHWGVTIAGAVSVLVGIWVERRL